MFDPSSPDIGVNVFERRDWMTSDFRHLLEEEAKPHRLSSIPAPRGIGFTARGKVIADHAAHVFTRIIRKGLITCFNSSPMCWFYKKQNSVESSSFCSEFTVMKQTCECLRDFKHKLQMMGIVCEGPAFMHGDNQ